jgi:hypothetical protein
MRFKAFLAVMFLLAAWAVVIYGHRLMTMIDDESPHPVASNATVERRIHLVMESRYDSDRPRRFVCREE